MSHDMRNQVMKQPQILLHCRWSPTTLCRSRLRKMVKPRTDVLAEEVDCRHVPSSTSVTETCLRHISWPAT